MLTSHRLPTQFSHAFVRPPRGLTIPDDPDAALAFAVRTDRASDALLSEGRFEQAVKLSHAALEARAGATRCAA